MDYSTIRSSIIRELEAEAVATRKCLESIPQDKFDFQPHPTSMTMGYLVSLVAEVPLWIQYMVEVGEIDFATFKHKEVKTSKQLTQVFEENIAGVINALKKATAEQFERTFYLKSKGETLLAEKVSEYIGPTINHWIHHRGQLTVYMRICEIPVPSIYGPSGDVKNY